MEAKDLIVGKKYYFGNRKLTKGVYVGQCKRTEGIYFEIEGKHNYLIQDDEELDFYNCVGFLEKTIIIKPVEK